MSRELNARVPNKSAWKENLPESLQGARLLLSENNISTSIAAPMHGRVDQVFLTATNWLVPVDTKRRRTQKVYLKDVIQLSAYRFILERSSKELFGVALPVSSVGYLRSVWNGQATYLPVKLLNSVQMINLWARYHELKRHKLAAKPRVPEPFACMKCPKKDNCPRGSKL